MIPENIARLLASVPAELLADLFNLIETALTASNPKDAIARAAQVLAHEKVADAAIDQLFDAKRRVKELLK